ncbi:MAG: hypothetical protein U5K43_09730 [Halofilum sp. (in: g-proteobacteria)]|nr:hypothetical protein [Halofilum sp. (in: g-proteobacteria)]
MGAARGADRRRADRLRVRQLRRRAGATEADGDRALRLPDGHDAAAAGRREPARRARRPGDQAGSPAAPGARSSATAAAWWCTTTRARPTRPTWSCARSACARGSSSREAGLETNRGIVTDRALEASAAGIHALGDCAEVDGVLLPFIMPINHCARALGATLAGTRTEVDYPVMPVIAKTPCCPVQLYAPPRGTAGEWAEGHPEGGGTRSLFHDAEGRLRGFCLTGPAVQEKGEWAAQVPKTFDNLA